MKRILLLLAFSIIIFGCEKLGSDEKSGIYIDGHLECRLKSAFNGGGGLHIYKDYYSECPDFADAMVVIGRTRYPLDKDYSHQGDFINLICVSTPSSIGGLGIPLNQGKYEGNHAQVSSVEIIEFSGAKNEYRIVIKIVLRDKRTVVIKYFGSALPDNFYA